MKAATLLTGLTLYLCNSLQATADTVIPAFSADALSNWSIEEFSGSTQYRLITEQQNRVLEAIAENTASGLYYKQTIPIDSTTTLSWRWKVSAIAPGIDEHSKQGDDYPARIYIVVSDGPFFWQSRTLVYVWSSNQPINSQWDNAYTNKARMWALNSGTDGLNQWQSHQRNIQNDLKTAFGKHYTGIKAIAVMTDSDNSRHRFHSWYGDIILK